MESGNRSNRSGLFFILGLAAGAVTGWYLNSDRGREIRRDSAETLSKWSDKAVETAQQAVDKTRSYAEDLAAKAHNATSKARSTADEIMES